MSSKRKNATRKRVFVASPLRGDVERNVALAEDLCKAVIAAGHSPFAPHLFFTKFLDDQIESDRSAGIECGKSWLRTADELWLYADEREECTTGMLAELEFAERLPLAPLVRWMPTEWAHLRDRVPRVRRELKRAPIVRPPGMMEELEAPRANTSKLPVE